MYYQLPYCIFYTRHNKHGSFSFWNQVLDTSKFWTRKLLPTCAYLINFKKSPLFFFFSFLFNSTKRIITACELLQRWEYLESFFTVHRCLTKILYRRERPSKKLLSSTKSPVTFNRLLIYRQLDTREPAFAALVTLETPLSDNFSCIPSAAIQQHKHLSNNT